MERTGRAAPPAAPARRYLPMVQTPVEAEWALARTNSNGDLCENGIFRLEVRRRRKIGQRIGVESTFVFIVHGFVSGFPRHVAHALRAVRIPASRLRL